MQNIKYGNKNMKKKMLMVLMPMMLMSLLLSGCGNLKSEIISETQETEESISIDEKIVPDTDTESAVTIPTISAESISEETDLEETTLEEVDPKEADSLSLVMVGDVLLHTPVEKSALTEDGSYDYTAVFSHMKEQISEADLALVNQEVIIGGADLGISGYPAFNAPFEIADYLVDTGFDVILHATNHALDKGKKGLLNCISNWEEKYPDIYVTGVYDSEEEAQELLLIEENGITVAILNYTYGTNGISLPSDMPYAVNLLKEEKVVSDIQRAKELSDFVIVCPHWGTEYLLTPDSSQKKWTKIFLENEVDLVLGTHPHVIEPVEMLVDEATGHEMLVYYSLGNFVNWTSGTGAGVSNRMVGGMAQVTIERNDDGSVSVSDYGIEAICAHVTSGFGGVTVYPVSEYSDELAKQNEIISQAPDFSYDYVTNLCNQVWGDLWR